MESSEFSESQSIPGAMQTFRWNSYEYLSSRNFQVQSEHEWMLEYD